MSCNAKDVGSLLRRRGSGEGELKSIRLLCELDVSRRAEKLHTADGRWKVGITPE